MKTGKILSVAAILSTMTAADLQAAHGGGGGRGMAFHGGGGGFARSAPAFSGGAARPVTISGGGFAAPRMSSARFAAPRTAFVQPRYASTSVVRPAGTFMPGTRVARPVAFRRSIAPVNQRFVNQQFINQRFVNGRFDHRHDHDRFNHRHNRNIVVIAGVPYYYPYYASDYYPADSYYSDYYPSNYYSDDSSYVSPSATSTYATTYATPARYTYAVAGNSTVVAVQRELARAGYYHGTIDGIMGPRTRSAIVRFERDRGLAPAASINAPLLRSLGIA